MFNNQELTIEMPGLRNFARRLTKNHHEADDLLQYTLLRAMKFDPESYLENESVDAPQEKQLELNAVTEAMKKLSFTHQEILVMICVQGMTYQEVADCLNIAVGTVRSRLSRAREYLQELVEPVA